MYSQASAESGALFSSLRDVWEPSGQESALRRFPELAKIAIGSQNTTIYSNASLQDVPNDEANSFVREKMAGFWRNKIGVQPNSTTLHIAYQSKHDRIRCNLGFVERRFLTL